MGKAKRREAAVDLSHIVEDLRPLAVPIDECECDPRNANSHDEASIRGLMATLRQFGQRKAIVVNERTGFIAAGNGTWLAAKRLGWKHIARVRVQDDRLNHMAFAIADNQSATLSNWIDEIVQEQVAQLLEAGQFAELNESLLIGDLVAPDAGEDSDEPELEGKAVGAMTFRVVVTVADERAQAALIQRLEKEGFECQPLMS